MANVSSMDAPLGKLFALLAKWYVGAVDAKLVGLPIQRHFYVLAVIDDMHGQVTQSELAEMVFTDKATMVRIVDYLADSGLVQRVTDPKDRRAYRLQTTEKGASLVPHIKNAFNEVNEAVMDGFAKEEVVRAYAMLARMMCNLSRLPSEQVFLQFNRTGQLSKK